MTSSATRVRIIFIDSLAAESGDQFTRHQTPTEANRLESNTFTTAIEKTTRPKNLPEVDRGDRFERAAVRPARARNMRELENQPPSRILGIVMNW